MLKRAIIGFLVGYGLTSLLCHIFLALSAHADTGLAMQKLRQTSVMVNGLNCSGSGSIVEGKSGKHYLLTNQHVCLCAGWMGKVNATFEGGELVTGKIVKRDFAVDLCAAKVEDSRPALKIGDQLLPFTEVNTRGYPAGRLAESHGRIKGNVEWNMDMDIGDIGTCPEKSEKGYGFNGALASCRMHFTSTLSNLYGRPGSSGSAVVNDAGYLVGVISSFHPGDDYDAGLVPFSEVRDFLSKL